MTLNPQIKIDLPADPGVAGDPREELFAKIAGAPITVTLSLGSILGVANFAWTITDQPVGASATLSDPSVASPTFVANQDIPGTYTIRCIINFGTESTKNGISFSTENEALRPPAAGETIEFDPDEGWKVAMSKVINLVDDIAASNVWQRLGTVLSTLNSGDTVQIEDLFIDGPSRCTPDSITATDSGVAASIATVLTEITTNGDSDLDDVTLVDGSNGQLKYFAIVAVGNAADSVKITPANMIGGTQITFASNPLGLGCIMVFDSGAGGWCVVGNNGGVIS